MKILSLILWVLIRGFWAMIDAKRNDKKQGILFGYHIIGFIIAYWIAFLLIAFVYYRGLDVPYNLETLGIFILKGGLSWLTFDELYKIFRDRPNLPHNFVGTTSWLDRIFHIFRHPYAVQMVFKIAMIIAGALLVIFGGQ